MAKIVCQYFFIHFPGGQQALYNLAIGFGPLILVAFIWLVSYLKVVTEDERLVVFTLGKVNREPKGPGLVFVFRPFQTAIRISLRTVVLDVPSQDIKSRQLRL